MQSAGEVLSEEAGAMAAKKKGKAEKGKKGKEKADGAKAPCDGEEARARGSARPPPAQLSCARGALRR